MARAPRIEGRYLTSGMTPNPISELSKPSVRYVRTADLALDGLSAWGLDLLSPIERAAFDRLKPAPSKRDYLAAHLSLRFGVAKVLGVAPQDVPLRYEASGRPVIGGALIQVSLSHCLGLGASAVSAVGDPVAIGIDAEPLTAGTQVEEVEALALTAAEQAWAAAVASERHVRLVALWTAKEAVLKARGVGIGGSGGVNGLLQVDCRPVRWLAGCEGDFETGTERVTTWRLPGDYCLAFARPGTGQPDRIEPEELVLSPSMG